ncbi:MAG: HetP family heterocyst commitment protein [Cyanothece sp. SIO1E1]|nr:HetP family heterocyst commitment protein [Cyanothece sp. SIO1E1]
MVSDEFLVNSEQLNQIIEAIIAGKYSRACALLLKFVGYNPLHYIPYRTYSRAMKYDCGINNEKTYSSGNRPRQQPLDVDTRDLVTRKSASRIDDLSYLETVQDQHSAIRGGSHLLWLTEITSDLIPLEF